MVYKNVFLEDLNDGVILNVLQKMGIVEIVPVKCYYQLNRFTINYFSADAFRKEFLTFIRWSSNESRLYSRT
jgi:hypothetical protein